MSNEKTNSHMKHLVKSYHLLFLAILEPMISYSNACSIGNKIGSEPVGLNEEEGGKS